MAFAEVVQGNEKLKDIKMSDDREKQQTREEALAENKQLMEEMFSKLDEVEKVLDRTIATYESTLALVNQFKSIKDAVTSAEQSKLAVDKGMLAGLFAEMNMQGLEEDEKAAREEIKNYKLQKEEIIRRREEAMKEYYQIHGCYPKLKS